MAENFVRNMQNRLTMDVHPWYNKSATEGKEVRNMNMSEVARLIIGLRDAGWTEEKINDFLLWIETGDSQYKPNGK